MRRLGLALLAAVLFALPGEASAEDGVNFRFGASAEGGGPHGNGPDAYSAGFFFLMADATLGIPLTDSFELVTGGFVGVGASLLSLSLGGEEEDDRSPGLLGFGAGGALRLGGWRFSAIAAIVASRLDSREGIVEPPVGPGLRAEISHTWWPSKHFGLGLAAHGTLAGLTPEDTMMPVGTAGLGYHFAFR